MSMFVVKSKIDHISVFMKFLLAILLLYFSNSLQAQVSSNDSLLQDIIKTVNPSVHALNEIKKMKLFDSTFASNSTQYYRKNGNSKIYPFDFSPYVSYLRNIIINDDDLFLRQYAAMQIPIINLNGCTLVSQDSILKKTCLQILKPEDMIWRLEPEYSILIFTNMYVNFAITENLLSKKPKSEFSEVLNTQLNENDDIIMKKSFEYIGSIYKNNPDRTVKANAILQILDRAYLFEYYDKVDYYYNILKTDYSDIKIDEIKYALIQYNPEGRLRVGNTGPVFNLPLIDSDKTISQKTLKGKYYLLQFWATWCGPCLAEMPEIREYYKKYKSNNFTIVSISLDQSLERLKDYWKKEGAMPWYNIILKDSFDNNFVKYLGITSVPVIILVGPDGKILANSNSAAKPTLEEIYK